VLQIQELLGHVLGATSLESFQLAQAAFNSTYYFSSSIVALHY
jgi:hypothetical protein